MDRERLKFIIASISGNVLEWYDFALYGYFATVIAKLFFPTKNEFLSLVMAFSVFASGFIVRPIGGLFFGYLGDKYGRRIALIISIFLIIFPTALIGILPVYSSIGLSAPILLTIMRLLQGVAVSGELVGSGVFLVECASNKTKGFYGSLIMCSTYLGLLTGAAMCVIISMLFNTTQVESFAWRIPFIISFFFGIGALLLRINCQESPVFKKMREEKRVLSSPIYFSIRNFAWSLILTCLVGSVLAVAIYLLIGYFPSYFQISKHMAFSQSMIVSFIGLLVLTICVPVIGWLSDIVGHIKILCFGVLCFLVFSYFIFDIASRGSLYSAIASVVLIALILSPIAASIIVTISSIFPANVRYSSVSIGYNMSMSIFGGTAPLASIFLCKHMKSELAPSVLLVFTSILTLIALFFLNNKKIEAMKSEF
jgi:MFS family permease